MLAQPASQLGESVERGVRPAVARRHRRAGASMRPRRGSRRRSATGTPLARRAPADAEPGDAVRRLVGDVGAVELDRSAATGTHPADRVEDGGLPGTVRAEEREGRARGGRRGRCRPRSPPRRCTPASPRTRRAGHVREPPSALGPTDGGDRRPAPASEGRVAGPRSDAGARLARSIHGRSTAVPQRRRARRRGRSGTPEHDEHAERGGQDAARTHPGTSRCPTNTNDAEQRADRRTPMPPTTVALKCVMLRSGVSSWSG